MARFLYHSFLFFLSSFYIILCVLLDQLKIVIFNFLVFTFTKRAKMLTFYFIIREKKFDHFLECRKGSGFRRIGKSQRTLPARLASRPYLPARLASRPFLVYNLSWGENHCFFTFYHSCLALIYYLNKYIYITPLNPEIQLYNMGIEPYVSVVWRSSCHVATMSMLNSIWNSILSRAFQPAVRQTCTLYNSFQCLKYSIAN